MQTAEPVNTPLPDDARRTPHENFPVLSIAVPRPLRPAFAAVYTFCRLSDDIADDAAVSPGRRLAHLASWRTELDRCFEGRPDLPAFQRLLPSIRAHDLPPEPFHRLLDAFEQDQATTRYETWAQLEAYAGLSANPVGELVLRIGGHAPADETWTGVLELSDRTCTALQFINFWQDVRRDLLSLDRIYIPLREVGTDERELRSLAAGPASEANRERYARILRPLVERTDAVMRSADHLPLLVDPRLRRAIVLFQRAGLLVSRRIRIGGYRTIWRRPRVPRSSLAFMACAAMLQRGGR